MINTNNPILAAREVLNKIEDENGKITYPINPFELLKEYNAVITYSNFNKMDEINEIINNFTFI